MTNPSCVKCGIEWSKIVPLCLISGLYLCGNCLEVVKKKEREEIQRRILET